MAQLCGRASSTDALLRSAVIASQRDTLSAAALVPAVLLWLQHCDPGRACLVTRVDSVVLWLCLCVFMPETSQ